MRADERQESCSLHVSGYCIDRIRTEDIRECFRRYGPVVDVYLPRKYGSKRFRGFAYVEFTLPEDAAFALDQLNGEVCLSIIGIDLNQFIEIS